MTEYFDTRAREQIEAGLWFEHAISGVTMKSPDGTNRQQAISEMMVGEGLELVRDPQNPYDHNAIKLLDRRGQHIGFVSAKKEDWWHEEGGLAAWLAPRLDNGECWRVYVRAIVGGDRKFGGGSLGARVIFVCYEPLEYLPVQSHHPLREEHVFQGQLPLQSWVYAMLGDAYNHWNMLSPKEQKRVNQIARGILKLGGAPSYIAEELSEMVQEALRGQQMRESKDSNL